MSLQKNHTINLINKESCFDLQFRRDVRYERPNQPAYYRWKAQFVITSEKGAKKSLEEVKNILGCGKIYFGKNQIRYLVQNIDDLYNSVVSFFKEQEFSENKKRDFALWSEAVGVIYKNKRKSLAVWKKKDFQKLMGIQKLMQKYKAKKQPNFKWLSEAESIVRILKA